MAVTIAIIGLDALGQSIGLALRASGQPLTLVAHDRDGKNAAQAVSLGAADRHEWNLLRAVEGADLVILNEPPHLLRETMALIAPELRRDAVVTDTSTSKAAVLDWAAELLPPTVHFVGGTPLVSPRQPSATAFQKRRYALVLQPTTPEPAVRLVSNMVALMGAEPLFIEATEHDALVAAVAHLPTLLSVALLDVTATSPGWREMAAMAGPTYAAATLLPATDAATLATLLRLNRAPLLHWLAQMQATLATLEGHLERPDDGAALEAQLATLLEARARWLQEESQAAEGAFYEEAIADAKSSSGIGRLFGFGRRKKE